jgi:hypothetical protein
MRACWDGAPGRAETSDCPGQRLPLEPLLGSFTIWQPC